LLQHLVSFFNELDTRQGTLLQTLDHRPKEAMASKRLSSDGRTILWKGYRLRDSNEKSGSNASNT